MSVFQRGRKQGPLLWAYWCCCVENRERKHALFRHLVFFPWRCNKIKRFPLHTLFFLFYFIICLEKREEKAVFQEGKFAIVPCWLRLGLGAAPSFPASLPSERRMPHWFQILTFVLRAQLELVWQMDFTCCRKTQPPPPSTSRLAQSHPQEQETASCPQAPSAAASSCAGPCLYIC